MAVKQYTKATHLVETVKPLVSLDVKESDADEAESELRAAPLTDVHYNEIKVDI